MGTYGVYVHAAVLLYFLAVNFIGFAMMGADKQRAKKHAWRVRESSLFLIAIIGGSAGCWLGMYVFRHKTRHASFVVGMPLILALQIVLMVKAAEWRFL